MSNQVARLNFETEVDPKYQVVHIDGALGMLNPAMGQMMLYYDRPEYSMGSVPVGTNPEMKVESVKRVIVIDVRTSPEVFKSIAVWMNDRVKEYEKMVQSGVKPSESQTYYQ